MIRLEQGRLSFSLTCFRLEMDLHAISASISDPHIALFNQSTDANRAKRPLEIVMVRKAPYHCLSKMGKYGTWKHPRSMRRSQFVVSSICTSYLLFEDVDNEESRIVDVGSESSKSSNVFSKKSMSVEGDDAPKVDIAFRLRMTKRDSCRA